MKRIPVVPRRVAQRDVEDAIDHYLKEASALVAEGFIGALEQGYAHIARHPATGSPRYAHELDLPGLRSWSLKRYPFLVFYVEETGHIDIWRVLHAERDIPSWLGKQDS